jgi:Ca2+-binding RTX toxin-like protein
MAGLIGTNGNDVSTIPTTAGADTAYGLDGADTIKGLGGNDRLYGDDGVDLLQGNDGNDYLEGGDGNDQVQGGANDDVEYGGEGDDDIGAALVGTPSVLDEEDDAGDDEQYGGGGNDRMQGGTDDDYMEGGTGDDQMRGDLETANAGDGDDEMHGGAGNDTMQGGAGDDELHGGSGNDQITGGLGQDDMFGGSGADTFFFNSVEEIGKGLTSDRIGDFSRQENDIIDLSLIDAKANKTGDQEFKFIGDDNFTKAGQLSFKNGKVKLNTDNDKAAEAILLVNTNKMDGDDFVL